MIPPSGSNRSDYPTDRSLCQYVRAKIPPGSPFLLNNENKLAWSIGGKYKFPFGTIGFWHGGATAYTYEASYSNYATLPYNANTVPYEYMYYPTVVWNGNIIDPRDSNIGFPWGRTR